MEPARLLDCLFADLPGEKIVESPERVPSVTEIAQRANLALVASLLTRAVAVSVDADDNFRALVRQAKLKGLLCSVRERPSSGGGRVEMSGPYALFRRTIVYGRALASVVPYLARCRDAELRAACVLDGGDQTSTLIVRATDPLFPAPEGKRYDSQLEAQFFHDFCKLAPSWYVVREPAAIPVEGTLIFPDFELRHRADASRRWLLEIVGFWTPEYIEEKLRRLRSADLDNFIVCVDEQRNCSAADLPSRAQLITYRRRVDAAAVLRIIERGRSGWPLADGCKAPGALGEPNAAMARGRMTTT
jgi:hypothetical protein